MLDHSAITQEMFTIKMIPGVVNSFFLDSLLDLFIISPILEEIFWVYPRLIFFFLLYSLHSSQFHTSNFSCYPEFCFGVSSAGN